MTCFATTSRTFLFFSAFTAVLRTVGLFSSFRAMAFFTVFASLSGFAYAACSNSRRSFLFRRSRRDFSPSVRPPCSVAMISSSRSP